MGYRKVPKRQLSLRNQVGRPPKRLTRKSKSRLLSILRRSLKRVKGELLVTDATRFKFALHRLPPSLRVLNQIRPLFPSRPDLSGVLAAYAGKFYHSARCQEALHSTLSADPVYDASAGDYVLALDRIVPLSRCGKFKRLVSKLPARSEERSLLLRFPAKLFIYRRSGLATTTAKLLKEKHPLQIGLLLQALISGPSHSVSAKSLMLPIREFAASTDTDLCRFCTYLMLSELKLIPRRPGTAGRLLLRHLGLRVQLGRRSLLVRFFDDLFGLRVGLDWERLLGKRTHSEAQRRSNVIRGLWGGNPSILVTALDGFNDLLIQRFSQRHPALTAAFRKAAGPNNRIPDFGNWVQNGSLKKVIPVCSVRMEECHKLRIDAELAHAVQKKTGRHTRPISYDESERMMRRLPMAYGELLTEWQRL